MEPKNQDRDSKFIQGKSVLITGGTTGIGRATALLLASKGARVLIFGREKEPLMDTLEDIHQIGGKVFGLNADVSKKEDVYRVFEAVDDKLGGALDFLINNAGIGGGSIADASYGEQEYVIKTNLLGYVTVAGEAIKRMKSQGGHIVMIGSMSADVRGKGSSLYVATKSGIQGLCESLRKEVNNLGIKVSLIEPGWVGTDMSGFSPEEQRKRQKQLKQLKAEDIANCIYYVLTRPKRMDIVEMKVRPHLQLI